jgi:hypothetical protein
MDRWAICLGGGVDVGGAGVGGGVGGACSVYLHLQHFKAIDCANVSCHYKVNWSLWRAHERIGDRVRVTSPGPLFIGVSGLDQGTLCTYALKQRLQLEMLQQKTHYFATLSCKLPWSTWSGHSQLSTHCDGIIRKGGAACGGVLG